MHSIRFRFMAFLALLLVVLLLLLNTYPVIYSRDAVFQEKRSSMSSQAALLASSLSGLERLNQEGIAEVLTFLDLSGYDRVAVVDAAGGLLYDSGETALETEDIRRALEGKTVFRSRFGETAFLSSLAMPMSDQGELTGAVFLQERDTERAEGIWTVQRHLRTVSLIIGAAALVIAGLFVLLITRRIGELVNSMRTVAGGDYGYRHSIRGRDEISELGKELNQLTERLESNETERRRFVADASHELKTPLASIRMLSDSIVQSEEMDAGTMREFVADIDGEAKRLQRTTEKLLTLSRLDDEVSFAPEPVDLKQAALDALTLLRPLAQGKRVRLRSELEEGCVVMGSRDDMDHILSNLIENAIKYNVPDGSVLVRLYAGENWVSLSVEDTGIGIPEVDRPNIFDRFYRVDKARSREAGGSGLGLSIVHDAVLAHGGSITVGQNKPQGTVFTVQFPRPTSEETGI
jgi:signal transduction histidine kinase